MQGPKQRRVLIVLAVILAALAAGGMAFMLRGPSYPPVSTAEPDMNAIEPYQVEMRCIDGVLRNRALKAEQVQPALDRCRAASLGGNLSSEQ